MQDMEPPIVNGRGTETGQVITTTVGGRDGKPKQVIPFSFENSDTLFFWD